MVCFSPFLNFFMVKFKLSVDLVNNRFSPFLNFFMVKSAIRGATGQDVLVPF